MGQIFYVAIRLIAKRFSASHATCEFVNKRSQSNRAFSDISLEKYTLLFLVNLLKIIIAYRIICNLLVFYGQGIEDGTRQSFTAQVYSFRGKRKEFCFRKSTLLIIALLFHVVAPKGAVLFCEGAPHS